MSEVPTTIKCKLCKMSAYHLCDTANEHGDIEMIHHYRCGNCGLVFVGNSITSEQIGAAYATLDTSKYYSEVKETTERKFEKATKNLLSLTISPQSSLIDIGTGHGDFLLFLRKAGFQSLSGHEIPGEDTTALNENHIPVYKDYDYSSIPSSSFDFVTLLDVMEHVPEPYTLFQAVYRILKPGGIAYCHTPCVTITDRLMHWLQKVPVLGSVGRAWQRARTSIFHLQNYTPSSIQIILHQTGFATFRISRENELSWPVRRYLRVYLCEKQGLPVFFSYVLTPFVYPFIATSSMNANKAIIVANKSYDRKLWTKA